MPVRKFINQHSLSLRSLRNHGHVMTTSSNPIWSVLSSGRKSDIFLHKRVSCGRKLCGSLFKTALLRLKLKSQIESICKPCKVVYLWKVEKYGILTMTLEAWLVLSELIREWGFSTDWVSTIVLPISQTLLVMMMSVVSLDNLWISTFEIGTMWSLTFAWYELGFRGKDEAQIDYDHLRRPDWKVSLNLRFKRVKTLSPSSLLLLNGWYFLLNASLPH